MARYLLRVSALVVLLLGCGVLFGDDTPTSSRIRRYLPVGWSKLGLTGDQRAQLRKIHGEYQSKIADLQKQIDQLVRQRTAEMRKVLTDAQRTRLKELMANRAGLENEEGETKAKEKTNGKK